MVEKVEISVQSNVEQIRKQLDYLAVKELPYATALAINSMANGIKDMERENFRNTFDKPTPFTMNAMGIKYATKDKPEALVFVKDIQAKYLEPYEYTFMQLPHKSAMLVPKGIGVNQYGNIPNNRMKTLLGLDLNDPKKMKLMSARKKANLQKNRKQYFIGGVMRGGQRISGLWQRLPDRKGLKLMVRFGDPQQLHQRLDYHYRAKRFIDTHFDRILLLATQHAMDKTAGLV